MAMSNKLKLTKAVTELHIALVFLIITLTINIMYLEISNQGEIDVNALTLMGATSKDGRSTIGMFGTGNKYALALLLREGYEISIFSGMKEIKITTKEQVFRDKTFQVIYIDGQRTSITTETGKLNWKLWMAVRELYSNAIDEGDGYLRQAERIVPEKDKTKVYLKINRMEVKSLVDNIRQYFPSSGSIIYENELGRVYNAYSPDSKTHYYRKGILMMESPSPCIYNYDIFNVRLDENRRPQYTWELEEKLWHFILSIEDKDILRNIFKAHKTNSDFSEANVSGIATIPKTNFKTSQEVATELNVVPKEFCGMLDQESLRVSTPIPKKIYVSIKGQNEFEGMRWLDQAGTFVETEPNNMQRHLLSKAMDFFMEVGFEIHGEIKIAQFERKHIFGTADKDNNVMYISTKTFDHGLQKVIETIMEESFHIESEFSDNTREFQDFLITRMVNMYKKYHTYTL